MKRGITVIAILFLVLTLPLATAGIFDIFKSKPQLGPGETDQDVSVIISDNVPVLDIISATNPTILPGGSDPTTITFQIYDPNGASNVDLGGGASVLVTVTSDSGAGSESRTTTSCTTTATPVTNGFEYECDIDMFYYDKAGTWDADINFTAVDTTVVIDNDGTEGTDDDFVVSQLVSIYLDPTTISFGTVSPGQDTASPITTVTNDGNYNIVGSVTEGLELTSTPLIGTDLVTQIDADVFDAIDGTTLGGGDACTHVSRTLLTGSPVIIQTFNLNKGVLPTETLTYCLHTPSPLASQSYSTTNGGTPWQLTVDAIP